MIHDIADPEWMLGPALRPALAAIGQHNLAFDCLVRPAHLRSLRRLLDRHPELRAVIDHGAKPEIAAGHFEPWAGEMRGLARETAVYCKLSGLVTEAGRDWTVDRMRRYIDHLVDIFTPERLLWGSDWPVVTLAASYDDWWTAAHRCLEGVDRAALDQIFGGTAVRFYRIDKRAI